MTSTLGPTAHEDLDLLVTAAVMYYEQGASQQEIADRLGTSRATLGRLLRRARELGVVRIEVVPPEVDPTLSGRLCERLRLRSVHIVAGKAAEAAPGPLLAEALSGALDSADLQSGDVVLVSRGRALNNASQHLTRFHPGVVVAPAMGGSTSDQAWLQPNEIARCFAFAFGARARFLNAPALVSRQLGESLRSEAGVREVVALWDRAKVAVVGVGAWFTSDSTYARAGYPIADPHPVDAVGHVAGWSFTIDGSIVRDGDTREFLGIAPEQLRRIPHVICLAGEASKARAAIGAARAGLISVLVTDATTARAIDVQLNDESRRSS